VPVMPVESNRGKKSGGEEGKNLAARQQRLKEREREREGGRGRKGSIAPANLQSDSRAIGWPTGRHVVSKQARIQARVSKFTERKVNHRSRPLRGDDYVTLPPPPTQPAFGEENRGRAGCALDATRNRTKGELRAGRLNCNCALNTLADETDFRLTPAKRLRHRSSRRL